MMCSIRNPEANEREPRTNAHSMCENTSYSYAAECACICSAKDRSEGDKGTVKYAKSESEAVLKKQYYHIMQER